MLERETGFEPATFCLGSRYSATELLPLIGGARVERLSRFYHIIAFWA